MDSLGEGNYLLILILTTINDLIYISFCFRPTITSTQYFLEFLFLESPYLLIIFHHILFPHYICIYDIPNKVYTFICIYYENQYVHQLFETKHQLHLEQKMVWPQKGKQSKLIQKQLNTSNQQ